MDNIVPLSVDGDVAVETTLKQVDSADSQSSPLRETDSMAPKATLKAEAKADEKPCTKPKSKSPPRPKEDAGWNIEDFIRDADWFATNCSLPNEGDVPVRVSDVSEENLKDCFGEKNRNGYKLNSCVAIPVEELLALSQVADGYEKPVNGIISLTFAKGAYVQWILKRKVNWASYAASKLKGQLSQCHRDGKSKPDGPPWIRKPMRYTPPASECKKVVTAAVQKPEKSQLLETEQLSTKMDEKRGEVHDDLSSEAVIDRSGASLELSMYSGGRNAVAHNESLVQSTSLELLSLIARQVDKTKNRLLKVNEDLCKVQDTVGRLTSQQAGHTVAETTLTSEIARLDDELVVCQQKVQDEEDHVGEITMDMELESNKDSGGEEPDEVSSDLLTMMAQRLAAHEKAALSWRSILNQSESTLASTKHQLSRERSKLASLPLTVLKLKTLLHSLDVERVKIESLLAEQLREEKVVRRTLSKECAPLLPVYVLTSPGPFLAQVTVTSCPLCCNGYHCNNWVPASCGHTYHPVCLFTHLTSGKANAKCLACDEPLNPDWRRSWGLDTSWRDKEDLAVHEGLLNENEDLYGKDCSRLPQRRQWVQNLANLHTQDDRDEMAAVSGLHSSVPSDWIDDVDVVIVGPGKSMQPLLAPKIEGETGKRAPAIAKVGSADRMLSSTPSSVEQHSPLLHQSNFSLPLTPTATLPFSPESTIAFKPYNLVKTPTSLEPTIGKRKSLRVERIRKKQPLRYPE